MMKTEVGRVWVTSLPVQKEELENILSVIAFGIRKLSRNSQEDMVRNLWKFNAGDEKLNFDTYILFVNKSVHDENFTGCPLYIMIIATVYETE
jgi:hypothetical protein